MCIRGDFLILEKILCLARDWHRSWCFKIPQAVQSLLWSFCASWCPFWDQNSTDTSANSSQQSQSQHPTRKSRFVLPTSLKTEQHNNLSPKSSHNSSSGTWSLLGTKHISPTKCKILLWINVSSWGPLDFELSLRVLCTLPKESSTHWCWF